MLASLALAGCDLEETIGPGDDRMPNVIGKTATQANITLNKRGFGPSYGKQMPFDSDRCRVVFQKSPPGAKVRPYSTQQIRCEVRVPRVVGLTADRAESELEEEGLDAVFAGRRRDGCRVAARSGGPTARPQADIRLRLRC
jgi:beta-lactam-binding protein with PASTA domain